MPAYEQVLRASHSFNLLDARHAISVTERQRYILRVRTLSRQVAEAWQAKREALGFPLLKDPSAKAAAKAAAKASSKSAADSTSKNKSDKGEVTRG